MPRLHNENEYLGEPSLDDKPSLSIGILSEECINCGAHSFLAEHGSITCKCCHYGKVELASINYPEALKMFCSAIILMLSEHFQGLGNASEQRTKTA